MELATFFGQRFGSATGAGLNPRQHSMENPTENDRKPDSRAGCAVAEGSALSLRAVTVKVNITACKYTMADAREMLAAELRRIAETLEDDHGTFAESGNLGVADYGGWEISDPWENDGPNNRDEPTPVSAKSTHEEQ